MSSNKYYDEWETPRKAVLLRDVVHLVEKTFRPGVDIEHSTPAGTRVLIEGRMTEEARESYGGKRLYNAKIRGFGSLVEYGVDFAFIDEEENHVPQGN